MLYFRRVIKIKNMPTKPKTEEFFYQISADEAVKSLKSDKEQGLSEREAQKRLEEYGPNKLCEGKRRPMIFRFFDQFKDLMIIVLIVAAFLAYYLGDFRGGTILLVIVFVNSVIGFYQEFKAEKILESLKKIIQSKATVIRDGQKKEISQEDLVPGDLVYLEEGSAVPADIRLTQTTNFSTNDFILTGESVPQGKSADLIIEKKITVTDQDNLVFLGVTVAKGNALGVVYGTGMETEIGRIATSSESITRDLSPLQREMNILAKTLTKIAGVIAISLFVINFLLSMGNGEGIKLTVQLSILFAIGVAAACVPQGLPAQVSVALSLGVGRMAKRKAVVRKLSAVETLGSTMVICSDKTGTLTKNEMTITNCYVNGRAFEVTGIGYEPKGSILENGKKVSIERIKQFFEDGYLASNGRTNPPDRKHKGWYVIGDPTEAAFSPLAIKAGLNLEDLTKRFQVIHEIPFDSDRKRMTIIRKHKGKLIGYMKGGLESVLSVCTHINHSGDIIPFSDKEKKAILANGEKFAGQALRVIALAYRDLPMKSGMIADLRSKAKDLHILPGTPVIKAIEQKFIFAGFVTMIDPPRVGVKEAIKQAFNAHIRIMMITGDNAVTAKAIAERIGMFPEGAQSIARLQGTQNQVYTGDQIKRLTDPKLKQILKEKAVIFSRVSPEDKLRIVTLLKQMGEVVAVTGDGVNDTLSLKKSDIGVSMGKMGSEVAKEASEIVLLDDNFRTLIAAIREGRTIFKNLKKTILASITSNNGELACVLLGFIGVALGLPAPITAVQILAIDLVGEMLPLTALTFDPPEKHILDEPPRDLNEHIINKKSLVNLIFYGFWMGAAGFFSFVMVHHIAGGSVESGRAAAYCGIILCQYINILSRRTERSIFTSYLFTNKQLWVSFLISIVAVMILIYIKSVSIWFGFDAMILSDWAYPIIGAVVFLAWHEGRKLIVQMR